MSNFELLVVVLVTSAFSLATILGINAYDEAHKEENSMLCTYCLSNIKPENGYIKYEDGVFCNRDCLKEYLLEDAESSTLFEEIPEKEE